MLIFVYFPKIYSYLLVFVQLNRILCRSTHEGRETEHNGDVTSAEEYPTFYDSVHLHHPQIARRSVTHMTSSHVIVTSEPEHLTLGESHASQPWLYFRLTSDDTLAALRGRRIESASLKLFIRRPPHCGKDILYGCDVTINLVRPFINTTVREIVARERISLQRNHIVSFDVLKIIKHWLHSPSNNYGFLLQSESKLDIHELFHIPRHVSKNKHNRHKESFTNYKPVLHIGLKKRIVKRNPVVHDCTAHDRDVRCCRYPVWVKFSDIGWDDWVIAPAGYQAYYCSGSCPYNYKVATNFASVQWLLNDASGGRVPETHCSPTRHKHLAILYYDSNGKMILTEKRNMVVERCECL